MNQVGSGRTKGLNSFLFITIIIKLSQKKKKKIPIATWVDKQNIHELVFQLNYKQNISNWVSKQNVHELVSQFSYKKRVWLMYEHTLTNSFLESFYRKLKKLSKSLIAFSISYKIFPKMVY